MLMNVTLNIHVLVSKLVVAEQEDTLESSQTQTATGNEDVRDIKTTNRKHVPHNLARDINILILDRGDRQAQAEESK
ncbi:hypothetical protein SBOR_9559 [Sclerotinia borealis F-4128]|uniref:Uncharacterized protein n=1 Tax=Sclerotinia borealis (strain F-4128) TaxID=1432307 RepID=W9C650_SCLBF|nr:hypothetical protein SBOR_9559 [Sclerotinia borealis F-4128]